MRIARRESPPARTKMRGSALILVVAILGLLAVIGTVYIVSARTESASARAGSEGLNLDLARDAVMNQVRTALYSATVNGEGRVGVIEPNEDLPRFFDYPEHNGGKARDMPDFTSLPNNKHQLTPDQPWLARALHRASLKDDDVCDLPNVSDHPANSLITPVLNVMGDGTPDAVAHLLSYVSPQGERYRFGVRIVDLSLMANLNVGAPFASASPGSRDDPDGAFLTSYPLGDGGAIDNSRHNLYVKPFSTADWQQQIFQMERPDSGVAFFDVADELELRAESVSGPSPAARPVPVWSSLAANAARYTCWSFSRDLRLRNSPPMPVASTQQGTQPGTQPIVIAPPYTLNPANVAVYPPDCGPYVWPLAPAKVGINPRLDAGNPSEALFYLAKAATSIATAMEASGFSQTKARAFAVNYLTARWSGMKTDGNAYTFPAGPSIIDDKGICIRATDSAGGILATDTSEFGGPSDLAAVFPQNYGSSADENGRIYVGFLPQPFINKVAVEVSPSGRAPKIDAFAVELYNPFPVRLSLGGFVMQTSRTQNVIRLNGKAVDAHGFLTLLFTITPGVGTLKSRTRGPVENMGAGLLDASDGKIILGRNYIPRLHTQPDTVAEVDEYPYDTVAGTHMPVMPGIYVLRRLNQTTGNDPAWESAIASTDATTPHLEIGNKPVLGVLNAAPPAGAIEKLIVPIDLSDRYSEEVPSPSADVAGPLESLHNLNDFNRIPRICNIIQNPDIPPSSSQADQTNPLSRQLGALFATTPVPYTANTDFPYDAQVHFDFKAPAEFFKDPAHVPQPTDAFSYDARAVQLFDYLAVLDRVGDPSINIGGGRNDTAKLRLPGRINVNTADPATLAAIANMPSGVAGNIVAYRDRTSGSAGNYSAAPGRGIRTLAELLVPIADAGVSPRNLRERDADWARIINQCTTQSDSFAVYGYLEAIRPNPNFPGHAADDFYDVASTSNDPHDPAAKNIRLGARRWVAIVDRSWCNGMRGDGMFELPRVLGIRDR